MIISHKYKFIFFKTMKTAGTSLELYLHPFCGEEDVITSFKAAFDKDEQDVRDQNCCYTHPLLGEQIQHLSRYEVRALNKYKQHDNKFYEHMTAWEAKLVLEPEIWQSYTKFCVIRNPFDHVISHYFFRTKRFNLNLSFNKYLRAGVFLLNPHVYLDWETDEIMVDHVVRYESLQDGLAEVFEKVGVPFQNGLSIYKKNQFREPKTDYRSFLSRRQVRKIKKIYAKEIELFGYEF